MDALQRWKQTWLSSKQTPPEELFPKLVSAYGEPHRAYHNMSHLEECFGHLDASEMKLSDPFSFELALWFHDSIYDTLATDNESRSANWAREALSTIDEEILERIEALILITRHNAPPANTDQELMIDIDLAILGAEMARFDEYEEQIRQEYHWVPEETYRIVRAKILSDFAQRPALYHQPYFRDTFEENARSNLHRSLLTLSTL